jgi:hypothetical protein
VPINGAEVHDLAGRSEVAADAAPIAGEFFRVAGVDRCHDGVGEALGGEVVNHAHEADAGQADADHARRSVSGVTPTAGCDRQPRPLK